MDELGAGFFYTLGFATIAVIGGAAVVCVIGMLYNTKMWMNKKVEERAEKTIAEAARVSVDLKRVTEDTAANLQRHSESTAAILKKATEDTAAVLLEHHKEINAQNIAMLGEIENIVKDNSNQITGLVKAISDITVKSVKNE